MIAVAKPALLGICASVFTILGTILAVGGCASRQPSSASSALSAANVSAAQSAKVATAEPIAAAKPLPFTGRLVAGDPDQLPPAIARSLAPTAKVTFAYREQLIHNDYHEPMLFTALDPVTYLGAPLGDYGVTASATLTIAQGPWVIGDYTAKAFVSRSYTLYSSPTHREVEDAARAAVRAKIDARLYRDADQLALEIHNSAAP